MAFKAMPVSMANLPAQPLTSVDLDGLFAHAFAPYRHLLLAVSGGADSTALLHLVIAWTRAHGASAPIVSVATVDHGLRSGSAEEAAAVAQMAADLDVPHAVLMWTGDKPTTGIQAAARTARYKLLRAYVTAIGADALVLAHTEDDQAETVLMRLARGSGVEGLGGMAPVVVIDGMPIVRPLLDVPKAQLIATLKAGRTTWIEDPSNQNTAFERVRWRNAFAHLADLGLTADVVVESARRLRRAAVALDETTARALAPSAGVVAIDPLGVAAVHWPRLLDHPDEIRLRILTWLIERIGGAGVPVPLARLEAMTEGLDWRQPTGRTLGRVMFAADSASPDHVMLLREPGHVPPRAQMLVPGTSCVFDGRCTIALSKQCSHDVTVAALGAQGLQQIIQAGALKPRAPVDALHALPALWTGDHVLAAPHLGFARAPFDPAWVTARWLLE